MIRPRRHFPREQEGTRINERIRVKEVRVIGPDGSQLGIMDTRKAILLARQQGMDLAEISPKAKPPVCKILDYGKFKYEQKKKAKAAKKKQTVVLVKEIKFRPQTDEHDVDFKVKHISRFLEEGNKVRLSVRFRGREMAHTDLGRQLLKQVVDLVGNLGIVEQNAKMEGRVMSMVIAPNPKQKKAVKSDSSTTDAAAPPKPKQAVAAQEPAKA